MARRARNLLKRQKRSIALASLDALKIEGALLQPDMIARIAELDAAQQAEADYGLDPREKLREVAQTKFALAQSLHARYAGSDKGPQATRRFLSNMFTQVFEFTDLAPATPIVAQGRSFALGHAALGGRAPIVFAPSGQIDAANAQFADDGRRRSAAQMLQEYLNADDAALWGLVCDGATLRLYRDNAALTRPAFIEADLARIFDTDAPRMADFAALWLIIHASRFGPAGAAPSDCALERWREEGRKQGATAREKLREGVEAALLELGRGFLEHSSNGQLEAELRNGKLTPQAYLQGLLRLVYQFIFVLTAEDRDVLHIPPPADSDAYASWRAARGAYAGGYSLARLRDRAIKRQHRDRHGDSWDGVKILLRALWRGEPGLALPALGGLFARGEVRDFHDCALSNARLHEAIFRLAWIRTESGLQRVNWRDMETEELGSVYESLLELSPRVFGAEPFTFIDTRGNDRKTTASYYTPDSLVQALLDETLVPLIEETVKGKDAEQAVAALLDLKIIDPACGSGHFLLAAARRLATRIAQLKSPGAPSPAEFRHWLREAARRCLFGVDRNPMAVELAKVALWIETVEPGKPLTFLDAHIRCGDSLLGIYDLAALQLGIPDEAYAPLTGDDKEAAKAWKARNKAERDGRAQGELGLFAPPPGLLDAARAIDAKDEDDLASVEAKAEAFRTLLTGPDRWRMEVACDLYIAAFLLPKTAAPGRNAGETTSFIPTSRDVWDKLAGKQPYSLIEAQGIDAAREARAFHWPLEFPQVFFAGAARKAGFDLAIGNPPWERIKLQEQEFFAARAPDIAAAPNAAARQALIQALASKPDGSHERRLHQSFETAKRSAESSSIFARTSAGSGGRFPLTGTGDVNTYALFAELFSTVSRSAGVIIPTSIATDATTAPFFASLVAGARLAAVLSFFEIRRFFTATDDRNPFCILALADKSPSARFAFQLPSVAALSDDERHFSLTPDEISRINPNTKTAPVFRSRADADLTKFIYSRVPILIDASNSAHSSSWAVEFGTMFHMSNDSGLFSTAAQLAGSGAEFDGRNWVDSANTRYVPLIEAKMIHQFDHRWASYAGSSSEGVAVGDKNNPDFDIAARYWVPEGEVTSRLASKGWTRRWLMGWRRNARTTDERTWINGLIATAGVGDSIFLALSGALSTPSLAAAWLSTTNSLVADFVARQKVGGTNLSFYFLEQFPVPSPSAFSKDDLDFVVPRVLELTYTSHSMRPFAEDLGYTGAPFSWNEDRRALLRAELDARIARLYGLTRDQLRYILDPEDVMGKGYPSETFRVLKNNDIKKYGEYRTARLVLDAWDRDAASQTEIRQPAIAATAQPIAPSPGAGARPASSEPRFAALVQLAAILKALPDATPASRVRLAALYALEPRFLTKRLSADAAQEWETLIGAEAAVPDTGAVAAFVPAIDAHWRNAVTQLTGTHALVVVGNSWSAGARLFEIDTDGWPDIRASAVLKHMATLDEASSVSALPAEEQAWVMALAA